MRRAEVEGGLLLEHDGVNRDDVPRPHHAGPLDGVDAHPTDADDDDRLTRLDLSPVDRRAPTGGHPTGHQGHHAQRKVGIHLDQRRLVDDAVLGEGAQLGHDVEVLALEVVAHRSVGDLSGRERRRPEVAQVRVSGDAHPAAAADGEEAGRDVIAWLQASYPGSDLENQAATFMPSHHGKEPWFRLVGWSLAGSHVAFTDVLVRVAQAGGRPLDQNLLFAGRVKVDLLDLPVLLPTPEHRRMRLHFQSPCASSDLQWAAVKSLPRISAVRHEIMSATSEKSR